MRSPLCGPSVGIFHPPVRGEVGLEIGPCLDPLVVGLQARERIEAGFEHHHVQVQQLKENVVGIRYSGSDEVLSLAVRLAVRLEDSLEARKHLSDHVFVVSRPLLLAVVGGVCQRRKGGANFGAALGGDVAERVLFLVCSVKTVRARQVSHNCLGLDQVFAALAIANRWDLAEFEQILIAQFGYILERQSVALVL